MANTYAGVGMLDRRVFVDLMDKAMDVIKMRPDRVKPTLGRFFVKETAITDTFKISDVSSVIDTPIKSEDGGLMPYSAPAPGFDKTITTVNFRRFVRATDDMRRMDLFNKAKAMLSGLPNSVKRLYELAMADLINNGFTSTTTADGKYLFSATHDQEDPSAKGGATYSNLETAGALTPTRFSTMRLNFRNQVNEKGYPDERMLKTVLIPPELEEMAHTITNAKMKPETALNDPNWNEATAEIVVSPWLTSTTAYYGFSDYDDTGLIFVERVAPNYKAVNYTDPDVIWGQRVKLAFAVAARHGRGVRGNAGA